MGVAVAVACMLAILAEIINDLHTVTRLALTRQRGQETTCTEIPTRQDRGEDIYPTTHHCGTWRVGLTYTTTRYLQILQEKTYMYQSQ